MATLTHSPAVITSLPDLLIFLSSITLFSTLYLDFEGKNLSRNGTLTILTVLVYPTQVISLIDIQTLGTSAFTTSSTNGKTLKAILEDPLTPKCIWDVRNDADALWAHHHVYLRGVIDVQLLENASRTGDKTYIRGLNICVEKDLKLKFMELHSWIKTKRDIQALMPNNIFAHRPLDAETIRYCSNDVVYLPALRETYIQRIDSQWIEKVMDESARRVVDACSPSYESQSGTKKLGPWGSGLEKAELALEEWLDKVDRRRMDEMQKDYMMDGREDDTSGYEDCYHAGSYRDAVWDDTFDSCWEK
ncbi:hypothetical protein GL218_08249 [Daldinia childiae]|uniref:uncharacterized protein n=1 Tax=Daldinia childiae TaxID=326645 RepID=UPI001446D449|nr:uncharacterized protein GL218_08249 [Daldinia childiae]KAF3068381.1 hypothetical protein GL218_08249 [Daldinia childiae]